MKNLMKIAFLLLAVPFIFMACNNGDPDNPSGEGKAKIENMSVSPTTNLKYGDEVTLNAELSDDTGLRSYTLKVSNASEDIYEKTQMLTGKTFTLNEKIAIPLPPNAVAGDITFAITVKNAGNEITTEEVELKNVTLPVFEKLYLDINNTVYEMKKNGNLFELEDFIPANAKGKIYANANKTGIFWGMDGESVKALGSGDIAVGKDEEAFFKISFDAVSFELTLGDAQSWSAMTESYYILGTISGHYQDGEIFTEKAKMKMNGFKLGNRKMWTWTPPSPEGTDDPEYTMWGNIVAGVFRFKKEGVEEYLTYSGGKIVSGADDKDNSFVTTAGGPYDFRVMADETGITSVRVFNDVRTLDYTNEGIFINGALASSSMSFADNSLSLVSGNYFLYEGTMELTKDQNVSAEGVDLANAFCDTDAFSGAGNKTWKFIRQTGTYYVRIDAFSGNIYIRDETGYPNAIYMDGWCWGKFPDDPRGAWEPKSRLTLYRVGDTNKYEAVLYVLPWKGDVAFFAAPPSHAEASQMAIKSKHFENINPQGDGMYLPEPASPGAYYKLTVDLKDGFTYDKENMDGTTYTLIPTNGKKFTVTFTEM